MIFSANQLFSNNQLVTTTAVSTNVIDLGVPGTPYDATAPLSQDVGKGNGIPILVQVTEASNNLISIAVAIVVSANEDLSSPRVLAEQTIPLAELKPGKKLSVQVLPNDASLRYLGIRYTVNASATAATTGRFTAGVTMGNQTNVTGA